jgi:hypothetical protein
MLGIEEKCWKRKKEMMDLVRSEEENKGVTLDLDRRPEAEAEAYGSLLFSSLLSSSLLSSSLLFSSLVAAEPDQIGSGLLFLTGGPERRRGGTCH